jgi:hypothetical protein
VIVVQPGRPGSMAGYFGRHSADHWAGDDTPTLVYTRRMLGDQNRPPRHARPEQPMLTGRQPDPVHGMPRWIADMLHGDQDRTLE